MRSMPHVLTHHSGNYENMYVYVNDCRCQPISPPPPELPCTEEQMSEYEEFCNEFLQHNELATCINILGADFIKNQIESCAFDACADGNAEEIVCGVFNGIMEQCNLKIAQRINWRPLVGCELDCEENQIYSPSISDCQASCQDRDPEGKCFEIPIEGCVCEEGFVHNGNFFLINFNKLSFLYI